MQPLEQQVEQFAIKIIEIHGFHYNEGFSCLIPDREPFPPNEGLLLWSFSQKRKRFETKVEKFHTATRITRMEKMLNLSEKEYKQLSSSIDSYLKSLKKIGFKDIGKGVNLFGKTKVFNVQAPASLFENNLEALKDFELLTMNNPIVQFADKQGYFKCQNQETLAWESCFSSTPTTTPTAPAPTPKKRSTQTSSDVTTVSTTVLKEKFQKIAATQSKAQVSSERDKIKKSWLNQVDGLYKKVKSWLSEYSQEGYITFNFNKLKLSEENLGDYEINSLELELVGGHKVIFEPVGRNVLGASGRIDLYLQGYKIYKQMLLLFNDGNNHFQWQLWNSQNQEEQQLFNQETLENLLNQWLEH